MSYFYRDQVAWLGRFVALHEIGPYAFVEFHPWVREKHVITKTPDLSKTEFALFVDKQDAHECFESLDRALLGGIAYKHTGGTGAAYYAAKVLNIVKESIG